MLGYSASDVINKITPADISDPKEVIERAKALTAELETTITPGFEALVFKASKGSRTSTNSLTFGRTGAAFLRWFQLRPSATDRTQ
jgi:hypothetical protein